MFGLIIHFKNILEEKYYRGRRYFFTKLKYFIFIFFITPFLPFLPYISFIFNFLVEFLIKFTCLFTKRFQKTKKKLFSFLTQIYISNIIIITFKHFFLIINRIIYIFTYLIPSTFKSLLYYILILFLNYLKFLRLKIHTTLFLIKYTLWTILNRFNNYLNFNKFLVKSYSFFLNILILLLKVFNFIIYFIIFTYFTGLVITTHITGPLLAAPVTSWFVISQSTFFFYTGCWGIIFLLVVYKPLRDIFLFDIKWNSQWKWWDWNTNVTSIPYILLFPSCIFIRIWRGYDKLWFTSYTLQSEKPKQSQPWHSFLTREWSEFKLLVNYWVNVIWNSLMDFYNFLSSFFS